MNAVESKELFEVKNNIIVWVLKTPERRAILQNE